MAETIGVLGAGLFSWVGAEETANRTRDSLALQKEQMKMNKEFMQFQLDRYNKWEQVFGSLQTDLGTYYKNLTGKDLSDLEIQQLQKYQQEANEKIRQAMEAKGINGSGIEASIINDNIYNTEMQKAQSVATANQRVAKLKSNFLALGLPYGNSIANSASNTLGMVNTMSGNLGNAMVGVGLAEKNKWDNLAYTSSKVGSMWDKWFPNGVESAIKGGV